jgi:hypothetical protein
MKYTYKEITWETGSKIIERTDEKGGIAWIPFDPANADYQEYLNPSPDKPLNGD